MNKQMTLERATEFAEAWNSGNAELVASYFAENGAYYASVGPDHLGKSFEGRENVRAGVQRFFDLFPSGKFENLKVNLYGNRGTFEWDFVTVGPDGERVVNAGCDLLEFEGDMVLKKNAFRKAR